MTHVGVLCNVDVRTDPREQLSASVVNRVFLIGRLLAGEDIHLFLYCPKDVDAAGEAPGFVLDGERLIPTCRAVPPVNANWTYRTRHLLRFGMGYERFKRWMHDRAHGIYVPYDFAELTANKQRTYDAVREWDPSLHPHTEDFGGSAEQIAAFLARSPSAFIKPRAGHKGNRVFVLRRGTHGHSLEYYDSRARRSFPSLPVTAILGLIDGAAVREPYVIQEGVESLRHQDSVFDVRVVMVHDGRRWHALFESRLSPPGSQLSNVYQGGTIRMTRELLAATIGAREGRVVEERLRAISHTVAERFEWRFPGALSEIGLDFVLDHERRPHLIEVNAKPGISGIGSETKLFDWSDEERPLHERWTMPHMRHLAGFLRHKVDAA
jgi:hypothetical protein